MEHTNQDIAIIGAGAAGCFAAANLPYKEGRKVIVFEKSQKSLQKVKVSGGGRCNVTHDCNDISELIKKYPRGQAFLKKSFCHFMPKDAVTWFVAHGVTLKTEEDGRMFPITDNSQTIIDALWQQLLRNKVDVRYGCHIVNVLKDDTGFELHFADGKRQKVNKILLATGSILKPEQFEWLTNFGHEIVAPVPSLFTFNMPQNPITTLMGLSVPYAMVKIIGTKFVQYGPLLITHWGLSGPAILKTSAYAARYLHEQQYNFQILVNWLGETNEQALRAELASIRQSMGKQKVMHKNPFGLPKRLWEYKTSYCGIDESVNWGELPAAAQSKLVQSLVQDIYAVSGKTTFKEEFVTAGGIALSQINPNTMESRMAPGLYFAGEAIDVDGITGGFNFQHAWCSGWLAAKAMIAS